MRAASGGALNSAYSQLHSARRLAIPSKTSPVGIEEISLTRGAESKVQDSENTDHGRVDLRKLQNES
jgi:hypothetical protein